MYKLVNSKNKTGYKGKRLTNDNLLSFSQRLLDIWEKAGIIEKTKTKENGKQKRRGTKQAESKEQSS